KKKGSGAAGGIEHGDRFEAAELFQRVAVAEPFTDSALGEHVDDLSRRVKTAAGRPLGGRHQPLEDLAEHRGIDTSTGRIALVDREVEASEDVFDDLAHQF